MLREATSCGCNCITLFNEEFLLIKVGEIVNGTLGDSALPEAIHGKPTVGVVTLRHPENLSTADIAPMAYSLSAISPEPALWTSFFSPRAPFVVAPTAGTGRIRLRSRSFLARRQRSSARWTDLSCESACKSDPLWWVMII